MDGKDKKFPSLEIFFKLIWTLIQSVNRPEPEDYSLLRWLHCFLCNSSTGYVCNSVTQVIENSLLKYSNSTDLFSFFILVTQK
jgi:hypothetical protein